MKIWPDEKRIDIIGANGNTGEHYELERLNRMEADAEAALTHIREMRREYINRNNLNKTKTER